MLSSVEWIVGSVFPQLNSDFGLNSKAGFSSWVLLHESYKMLLLHPGDKGS